MSNGRFMMRPVVLAAVAGIGAGIYLMVVRRWEREYRAVVKELGR